MNSPVVLNCRDKTQIKSSLNFRHESVTWPAVTIITKKNAKREVSNSLCC